MKQSNYIQILILFILFTGCQKDGIETIEQINNETIEDIFSGGEVIPRPESSYEETDQGYNAYEANNGSDFLCNGKKVKETVVLDKMTLNAFDDRSATNTASLYPGSIIKIKDFMEQNDLSGIGGIKRAPILVSSDLGDIREVSDPSQRGNVDKVIKEMELDAGSFSANVKSEAQEAYSFEQSMIHIGVDYRYLGNSVKGRFDVESSVEKHSFVVKFHQIYHTASVGNPESQAALFDPSIDPYRLNDIVAQNGPLGLITEVAYGRMLIGIFTYEGSDYSTSSEIEGKFRSGFNQISGNIDVDTRNFFSNSKFTVAILGGDAQEASKVAGSGLGMESIQAVFQWMKDGGSDPSLGVPIQYKIRQLSDPSYPLLAIAGAVEYDVPDCSQIPNHLVIKSTEVTALPPYDEDNHEWDYNQLLDKNKFPDVFQTYQRRTGGDWKWIAGFENEEWGDTKSSDLPKTLNVNIPISEQFLRDQHVVQFYDNDEYLGDSAEDGIGNNNLDEMGEIYFNFSPYLKSISNPENENAYPPSVEFSNGNITVIFHLEWSTKN